MLKTHTMQRNRIKWYMILYIFQCYFFSCVNSCYKVLKKQKYKMISFLYHESEKFKFMNTNAHNFFILNRCLNLIVIVIIFLIHLFLYQKYKLQFKKKTHIFAFIFFLNRNLLVIARTLHILYHHLSKHKCQWKHWFWLSRFIDDIRTIGKHF